MSQEQFLKEINSKFPAPIYYFYTKDLFLLKDALDRISLLISEDIREFNFFVYDIDSAGEILSHLQSVLDALNTPGFFEQRKVVVLRNAHLLQKRDIKHLYPYVEAPSPDSLLVMLSQKAPDRDLKERLKDARVICIDMKGLEIKAWLKEFAHSKGIDIASDALNFLIATIGSETGALFSEVEKIVLFGKQRIDTNDVSEVIYGTTQYNAFNLVEALITKDKGRVFRIYRAIQNTIEPHFMLGAINWKFSELSKKFNSDKKDYFHRVFRCLSEADRKLKSSGGGYPMEELFIKLLQI